MEKGILMQKKAFFFVMYSVNNVDIDKIMIFNKVYFLKEISNVSLVINMMKSFSHYI